MRVEHRVWISTLRAFPPSLWCRNQVHDCVTRGMRRELGMVERESADVPYETRIWVLGSSPAPHPAPRKKITGECTEKSANGLFPWRKSGECARELIL